MNSNIFMNISVT